MGIWKSETQFVTAGVKHLKFWTVQGQNCSSKEANFGGEMETNITSIEYDTDKKYLISGNSKGNIKVWQDENNFGDSPYVNIHENEKPIVTIKTHKNNIYTADVDGEIR